MKKLLKYDFFYLRKTSKFIVFGAIFILFSIVSPLTAKYIEEILSFLLNGQDLGLPLPDPTVFTSYEQYLSDLYEIVFIVTIFVAVSIFIRDKTKNLLPLIFSKPINRTKYILSKYITFAILLLCSIIVGYLVFSYYTYFLFDEVFFGIGLIIMFLYWVDLLFVTSIALFSATHFKSYLPAILITWGLYIVSSLFNLFGEVKVIKHFPSMIKTNMIHLLYDIHTTSDIIWNVVVTILFIGLFLGLSIRKIRSQDI